MFVPLLSPVFEGDMLRCDGYTKHNLIQRHSSNKSLTFNFAEALGMLNEAIGRLVETL
jgi:hypothetical protein